MPVIQIIVLRNGISCKVRVDEGLVFFVDMRIIHASYRVWMMNVLLSRSLKISVNPCGQPLF